MSEIKTLSYFAGGVWKPSASKETMDVYDPSTGKVIARAPCCTAAEVEEAVAAAQAAFPGWSSTPVAKRVQILFRLRELLLAHADELTRLIATENGKVWDEAYGDLKKVLEPLEFATGAPHLMMGQSLMDASSGFDTVLYREPVGVFAGIAPFNFPGMIPMGWMAPLCLATGNTLVLKAASMTPMTCMRIAELWQEAGLPAGVLNIVTCRRTEAELLLTHPAVKGVSFVGSTSVGRHVYEVAAAHGKRVQALCQAKNHALVLRDAPLKQTARGIINAAFGCAGERCMALPVVVAESAIADRLAELLVEYAREIKVGPAYEKTSDLGPLVSQSHLASVTGWIEQGVKEGARLLLDGRDVKVPDYENGFYLGPTILDQVTEEMSVGREEIFGPVLCIKRVADFEEGLAVMNANPYANGSVIFTASGRFAREFARRTHGGMVGVNVGIPVPVGYFPFTGHKDSFFGDLHTLGTDGVRFFTETKAVTTRWFPEEADGGKVDTWDGTMN